MGFEKNYDKEPTPRNIWEFIYRNKAIRLVVFFAFFIFMTGFCVNNCSSVVEKPKDVYRYEVTLSNWVGHTTYQCAWYERTEEGTYILYNEDSTQSRVFEVGSDWKIEITNIENK